MKSIYLPIVLGLVFFMAQSCGLTQTKEKPTEEKSAEDYYNLAQEASLVENMRGAILYCDKFIALDSTVADVYYLRGDSKLYIDRYAEAIADFDKTISLDSTHSYAYYLRGVSNMMLENYQVALVDFNKTMEIDPNHIGALISRGNCFLKLGDKEKGCQALATAADKGKRIDKTKATRLLKEYCE